MKTVKLQKYINGRWITVGKFSSRTAAWMSVYYKNISKYRVKGEIKI